MSEFDQGGGSGVDEPGTSNPNRVAVFFYLRKKCTFLFFDLRGKRGNRPFFTCDKRDIFGGRPSVFSSVLPPRKSTAVLAVPSLLPVKKVAKDDVTQIHPIGAMVQGY